MAPRAYFDHLVIGSGLAGLAFAVKMAQAFPERTLCVATKAREDESNTKYAQGGVATVLEGHGDSYGSHVRDTLLAGDGLCDPEVVEMVVRQGPERIRELVQWGATFDRDPMGRPHFGMEGGHSAPRVLHRRDQTGLELEMTLIAQVRDLPNIHLWEHHFALDLICGRAVCHGAHFLDLATGRTISVYASSTLLATGGIGRVYGHTTNPHIATGDGIAMAHRAGARITDMEFVQFHPTALYQEGGGPSFLISEAVRGFGAQLKNRQGRRFLLEADPRGELAPRDVVSRSIALELENSGADHVYLDCTGLDSQELREHFPTIYGRCLQQGLHMERDWIPVVPAAHYLCGGIEVDRNGRTDIENLFACGECSRTGLHGANRLASNSLLEALVYAHNSYEFLAQRPLGRKRAPRCTQGPTMGPGTAQDVQGALLALQGLMREKVGIIRTQKRLLAAQGELETMERALLAHSEGNPYDPRSLELRNLLAVAQLIVGQALQRGRNHGGHYNLDLIATTSP